MPNWGSTRIRQGEDRARRPENVSHERGRDIVRKWAEGMAYREIADFHGVTVAGARDVLKQHLKSLWQAKYKWKMAEMRCNALALELRLLRVGMEAPEDQPIEVLEPSEKSLKAFHMAGVHTVNQLRSVDAIVLAARDRFPRTALVWAILKLDSLGLSHRLKMERKDHVYPKGVEYLQLTGNRTAIEKYLAARKKQ